MFWNRQVLAIIMRECLEEFKDFSVDYIMENCFEKDGVHCQNLPVHRDESAPEKIRGDGTVDDSMTEGTVTFDVALTVRCPGQERDKVMLIVNQELQNKLNVGYKLVKRSIYYACRLISRQYGTVFSKSHYNDIRKVYSIWICPCLKSDGQESVNEYSIREKRLAGNHREPFQAYDMMRVVMCRLNPDGRESPLRLVGLLQTLLARNIPAEEKLRRLEETYSLNVEREMESMCTLEEFAVEATTCELNAKFRKERRRMKEAFLRREARKVEASRKDGFDRGQQNGIAIGMALVQIGQGTPVEHFRQRMSPEMYASLLVELERKRR